jgi:hypothetical protein
VGEEGEAVIICGDALTELRKLPDESVNMCVTSPRLRWMVDGLDSLIKRFAELDNMGSHGALAVAAPMGQGIVFALSQFENGACLFFLDGQEREKLLGYLSCQLVAGLIAIKRSLGILAVFGLSVIAPTECLLKETDGGLVHHPDLKPLMILGVDTVGASAGFLDAEIAFPINEPGQISNQFVFSHTSHIPQTGGDVK